VVRCAWLEQGECNERVNIEAKKRSNWGKLRVHWYVSSHVFLQGAKPPKHNKVTVYTLISFFFLFFSIIFLLLLL